MPPIKVVHGQITITNIDSSRTYTLHAPGLPDTKRTFYVYGAPLLNIRVYNGAGPPAGQEQTIVQVEVVDAAGRHVFNYDSSIEVAIEPGFGAAGFDRGGYFACFPLGNKLPPGDYTIQATSGNLPAATAQYTVKDIVPDVPTATPTLTPSITPTSTPISLTAVISPTVTPTPTALALSASPSQARGAFAARTASAWQAWESWLVATPPQHSKRTSLRRTQLAL